MTPHHGLIEWEPADVEVREVPYWEWLLATDPPLTGWEQTQKDEIQ